jgi:hypothetical protein
MKFKKFSCMKIKAYKLKATEVTCSIFKIAFLENHRIETLILLAIFLVCQKNYTAEA